MQAGAAMSRETAIDARELRRVLSTFVTGVTVVTTRDARGRPHGVTVNSFSSVSLDPPLVLWSQALGALSHPVFRDAGRYAINILADDQIETSNRFARAGEDKFAGVAVHDGLGGMPLIDGCAAYVECSPHARHEAGDHMIFVGRVERIERAQRRPLAFGGGRYLIAQPHDFARLSTAQANANRARLQAVRLATHAAVELSARLDETIGVAVWGTHGPTVVHWEPSSAPVSLNLRVGAVLPLRRSATGRIFAAWLPPETTAPFLAAEPAVRADADGAAWAPGLLETVRRDGVASVEVVSDFQDRSAVAVAAASAPVFDRDGQILLALTALGEAGRIDVSPGASLRTALIDCAAQLTRAIGGIPSLVSCPGAPSGMNSSPRVPT